MTIRNLKLWLREPHNVYIDYFYSDDARRFPFRLRAQVVNEYYRWLRREGCRISRLPRDTTKVRLGQL